MVFGIDFLRKKVYNENILLKMSKKQSRYFKLIKKGWRKMTDSEIELFISKCKIFISFMLHQQQWSGLTKLEIDNWVANFEPANSKEYYYIYKLLTNIIYYSESDIINALREGIKDKLFYKELLNMQVTANFSLSQQTLSQEYHTNLEKTCFIPLLDSDAPFESSNYILRLCVQNNFVSTHQSIFPNDLLSYVHKNDVKNLVIIDDCVGSGNQLRKFWKFTTISDGRTLRQFCKDMNIKAYYLSLFGLKDSISDLQNEYNDLTIICVKKFAQTLQVFDDESYVWDNIQEKNEALVYFNTFAENNSFSISGYNNLNLAIIMHRTIPNWSLPMFWKENSDWKPLMRRKSSNA